MAKPDDKGRDFSGDTVAKFAEETNNPTTLILDDAMVTRTDSPQDYVDALKEGLPFE